ncbi:hypothetical protein ACHAXT_009180 [Thalassiosira profunda]
MKEDKRNDNDAAAKEKGGASSNDGSADDGEREWEDPWQPPSPRRTRSVTARRRNRIASAGAKNPASNNSSQPSLPGYLRGTAASSARAWEKHRPASSNPEGAAGGTGRPPTRRSSRRNSQNKMSSSGSGSGSGDSDDAFGDAGRSARGRAAADRAASRGGGGSAGRFNYGGLPPANAAAGGSGSAGRFRARPVKQSAARAFAAGRSSTSNSNSAEDDEAGDPQLQHLLRRLGRERATNNLGESSELDRARARYLLEASAGNVGLASALYWEDYLAGAAPAAEGAAAASAASAQGSRPSPKKRKSGDMFGPDDDGEGSRPSSKRARRNLKTAGLDGHESEGGDAKPSAAEREAARETLRASAESLRSMHRWQRELERELDGRGAARGPSANRGAGEAGGAAEAAVAAALARADASALGMDSPAEAVARENYRRALQLGALGYGGDAAPAALGGLGSLGSPSRLSALFPNYGAGGPLPGELPGDPAFGSREWQEAVAAALRSAGDANLGAGNGPGSLAYARAQGEGGAPDDPRGLLARLMRLQAAGAGGGGDGDGSGDDDDNNSSSGNDDDRRGREGNEDDDVPNARDDDDGGDAEGGNPPRRSARLRSVRRSGGGRARPARNRPPADAAAVDMQQVIQRRLQAMDNDSDDDEDNMDRLPLPIADDEASDIDDVDGSFVPGPLPVFRLKKGQSGSASAGKRRREDGLPGLQCDSDSDLELDEEGLLSDVDKLLHASDAHSSPSPCLWDSYPCDDEGGSAGDHIPPSWLRSGFQLAACGNGLALQGSSGDEADDRGHRRPPGHVPKRGPLKGVDTLFPYNCKGVAALASIVTALIYAGASIQGGATVSCDAAKEPFGELETDQRKRQFDGRLVDALSSLLCLAAAAGRRRCEATLGRYETVMARRLRQGKLSPEEEDEYETKRRALQRRCGQCQVCWWETSDGAPLLPEGRDPADVAFNTSFTAAEDLRSYVKTHARSFKAPGGCALFLETILRAHGPLAEFSGLLKCRCKESAALLAKNGGERPAPEEHDCMTPQLLSLLLTGEVHSTFEDWDADALGIGYLRLQKQDSAPINPRLLRPVKPIWLCLGDLGHSVLLSPDARDRNCLADRSGAAFRLSNWNCWTGELTSFTVVTSMYEEEPLRLGGEQKLHLISDTEQEGRTVADSISERIRVEERRDAPLPWKNDKGTHANPDLKPIGDEELAAVASHPEDVNYYPGEYRRWRFRFGDGEAMGSDDEWIPFYRLRGRKRLVVEMKLAPRICGIVRGRWPAATVREFSPEGKFPVV